MALVSHHRMDSHFDDAEITESLLHIRTPSPKDSLISDDGYFDNSTAVDWMGKKQRRSSLKIHSEPRVFITSKKVQWAEDLAQYRFFQTRYEETEEVLERITEKEGSLNTSGRTCPSYPTQGARTRTLSEPVPIPSWEAKRSTYRKAHSVPSRKAKRPSFIRTNAHSTPVQRPGPYSLLVNDTDEPNDPDNPFREHIDANDASPPKLKTLAFRPLQCLWTSVKKGLRAIKLPSISWQSPETFLYEADPNVPFASNHEETAANANDESQNYNSDTPLLSKNTPKFHETSLLPSRLSWAQVTERSPSILQFKCQCTNTPPSQRYQEPSRDPNDNTISSPGWLRRFWTLMSSTSCLSNLIHGGPPKRTTTNASSETGESVRPDLHSRSSTSELLQTLKSFDRMKLREQRNMDRVGSTRRGREAMLLLGSCGSGLPVVFEDAGEDVCGCGGGGADVGVGEREREREMGCWRCDCCEEC